MERFPARGHRFNDDVVRACGSPRRRSSGLPNKRAVSSCARSRPTRGPSAAGADGQDRHRRGRRLAPDPVCELPSWLSGVASARVVVAVPAAPESTCEELKAESTT